MDSQPVSPSPPPPPPTPSLPTSGAESIDGDVEQSFRTPRAKTKWSDHWDSERSNFSSLFPPKRPRLVGAALDNLGNTCFLNSVLQCITHTVPLVQKLRSADHPSPCSTVEDGGFCVLCVLKEHVQRCLERSGDVVTPTEFAYNLSNISCDFKLGMQEDAHEFLHCFLDKLHSSCLNLSSKDRPSSLEEDSLVKQVFGGRLKSEVCCCACGHCSDTFEPLLDLSLEIDDAKSVDDALRSFTRVEKIEDPDIKFTCQGCGEQVAVEKQMKLDQAPSVLALHLKRFKHSGTFTSKLDEFVHYPLELDLKPYLSCTDDNKQFKYDLYAVIVHLGSAFSGHYYCYIRSSPTSWHDMDDDKVISVSETKVLDQTAYILFYLRQGTSPWFSSLMEEPKLIHCEIGNGTSPISVLDQIDRSSVSPVGETSCRISRERTEKDEWINPQTDVCPESTVEKTEGDPITISPAVTYCRSNHTIVDKASGDKSVAESVEVPVCGSSIQDVFEDEPLGDDNKDEQLIPQAPLENRRNQEVRKPFQEATNDPRVKELNRCLRSMPSSRKSAFMTCLSAMHSQGSTSTKRRKMF